MIKKIKIEVIIIAVLLLSIFISPSFDVVLYNEFLNYNNYLNNIYFKKFFINITEIGDSLWFFLIAIFLFFISFFRTKHININNNKRIRNVSIFLFSSILITGALTQIIKHIIGRPRPNLAIIQNDFEINFLSFESSFHSFPSGHTSTIFVVALMGGLLTPRIKYFYMFFAFLISFSRVVVGAHFFTDIVGGIAIAFLGFKITLYLFNKYVDRKIFYPIKKIDSNLFFLCLIIFFITIIFITIGSSIDIFISSLFYDGKQTFVLQSFNMITIISRKIFLPLLIIYILILPIITIYFPLKKIYLDFKFSFKSILFLWISMFFNLIIVINLMLKNNWGRERPNDILQFGGKDNFTPWFQISDSCLINCSFVSGDASVGFSLIALFFLTRNIFFFWFALFSGFFLGIIRVLEGGHFFSDIIIAGFIIFLLTYIQYNFIKKKYDD